MTEEKNSGATNSPKTFTLPLALANDETVLKHWQYESGTGKETTEYSLTITNLRLISCAQQNGAKNTDEISTSAISGLSCSSFVRSHKSLVLWGILLILLSLVVGFAISALPDFKYYIAIAGVFIGIVLIVLGGKRDGSFTLVIFTQPQQASQIGLNYGNVNKNITLADIPIDVAQDIQNNLGAYVWSKRR